MNTSFLLGSLIGAGVTLKAIKDLEATEKKRKYVYLKCLNDGLEKHLPLNAILPNCYSEGKRRVMLPYSVYFIGAISIIPFFVLIYKSIRKGA